LQKFYSVPSMEALQRLTLDPYRTILSYPNLGRSVWNSLFSRGERHVIMLVTSVICWMSSDETARPVAARQHCFLPMVFPGIVLGLAIMILYLYCRSALRHDLDHAHRLLTRSCPTACATTPRRCCKSTRA